MKNSKLNTLLMLASCLIVLSSQTGCVVSMKTELNQLKNQSVLKIITGPEDLAKTDIEYQRAQHLLKAHYKFTKIYTVLPPDIRQKYNIPYESGFYLVNNQGNIFELDNTFVQNNLPNGLQLNFDEGPVFEFPFEKIDRPQNLTHLMIHYYIDDFEVVGNGKTRPVKEMRAMLIPLVIQNVDATLWKIKFDSLRTQWKVLSEKGTAQPIKTVVSELLKSRQ